MVHDAEKDLGLGVSLGSGLFPPSASCCQILRDAFGKAVYLAEVELSLGKPLVGGLFVEFFGLPIILFDALATILHGSKGILGKRIALFRRALHFFNGSGMGDGKTIQLQRNDPE